jgi:Uncharacterized conserved protein (DUF2304)
MILSTKILALAACFALAVAVFELVRKKRIREEYSLLWLGVTATSAVLILFDGLTLRLINLAGGVNLSSLFFFGGVVFSVVMLLNLTVRISELKRKQNVLLQEAGLMREQIERLEKEIVQVKPPPQGELQ